MQCEKKRKKIVCFLLMGLGQDQQQLLCILGELAVEGSMAVTFGIIDMGQVKGDTMTHYP